MLVKANPSHYSRSVFQAVGGSKIFRKFWTEKAVMDEVHDLGHRKTIIKIGYRLSSTVSECDMIYVLKHGEPEASDSYDELVIRNEGFRTLASNDLQFFTVV